MIKPFLLYKIGILYTFLCNVRFIGHVLWEYYIYSMSVVFGLGMRLCVHMCTKLENGVLHNGQQPQSE